MRVQKGILWVVVCMLVASGLISCSGTNGSNVTVSDVGNIEGTITNSQTSQPVAGVIVAVGNTTETTNASGVFTITSIAVGARTITATKTGYQNYSGSVTVQKGTTVQHNIQLSSGTTGTNGNSVTVTDSTTNLTWQKVDDNVKRNWYDAGTYCNNAIIGGYNDWRLPSRDELSDLNSSLIYNQIEGTHYADLGGGQYAGMYWSSTSYDADHAYHVFLGPNNAEGQASKSGWTNLVRCVRSNVPSSSGNTSPVANAGPDQSVSTGAQVTLNGSASADTNGDALTYSWTFSSIPAGSAATLSSWTASNPTYTADVAGAYVLSLIVNDGTSSSVADTVSITATANPVASFKLPDTNQTMSYTTTTGEDSDYTITPSYTDNFNGTVTDNVTSLIWQQQDDGVTRDWTTAGAYCDGLNLAEYTDWRLPSVIELATIVDSSGANPAINATYFLNPHSFYYWSSSEYASVANRAWFVDFHYGGVTTDYSDKSAHVYVRCVRGGQWQASSFTDNGNGTVTDSQTGLVWQQVDDNSRKTWEDSLSYCEGLSLGGRTDWRLPNRMELMSIVDFSQFDPAINTAFPNTKSMYYWSSTTDATYTTTAWYVLFSYGHVISGNVKTTTHYVRCVRGGS